MNEEASECRVKGVTILGLIKLVKKRASEEDMQRVLDLLDDEDREVFDERILVSTWYPYRTFHNLLASIDEILGQGDGALAHEIGRVSAEMDLTTVYRSILSFLSPGFVTKRALAAWKNYYSPGQWEVIDEEKDGDNRLLRCRLAGFRTLSRVHCLNIVGWCEKFIELLGGKEIKVNEVACIHQGADNCEFLLTWSEKKDSSDG